MMNISAVRLLVVLAASQVLLACSSVTFVQVEQEGEHKTTNKWHHATLNGMVEISKPLDIRTVCHNKAWTKITTEHTFYNFMAEAVTPTFIPRILLYSAWTNKVQCHETPEEK